MHVWVLSAKFFENSHCVGEGTRGWLLKTKDKDKTLKAAREKQRATCRGQGHEQPRPPTRNSTAQRLETSLKQRKTAK